MQTVTVGKIMIPLDKYPHIKHTQTLREAMEILEHAVLVIEGRHQSLPRSLLVFNDDFELIGRVQRRDVLRGLEPDFLSQKPLEYRKKIFNSKFDPKLTGFTFDEIIQASKANAQKPIIEILQPFVTTVEYDDHIFKAIYEMNSHRQNLLPVLKDNEVVGVLRSVDVFHAVLELFKT